MSKSHRELIMNAILFPALAAISMLMQQQDSISRVGAVLARLHRGNQVRVHAPSLGWVQGFVDSTGPTALIVSRGDDQREIPFAGTDSVFLGHPQTGRGFLIGATIAGLLGAFVGAEVQNLCASGAVCGPQHGLVPIGFGVGALVGGVFGAAIGSASTRWSPEAP
jgi:hypothetical protein